MREFMSFCTVLMAVFLSSIFHFAFSHAGLRTDDGFSVDLIRRDSLVSRDLISRAAIIRPKNRADYLAFRSFTSSSPTVDLTATNGDFMMKLSLGEPPVVINGIVDTSSALSWTQCAPCHNCFSQTPPLFTPSSSSTYKLVPGASKLCKTLGGRPSILADNTCRYSMHYLNSSSSQGTISSDTLRINSTSGSPIVYRDFFFGCGYENIGKFNEEASGVVSLGSGPGSLITRLDSLIGGKFSYCLVYQGDHRVLRSSQMHFGSRALVAGAGVVSTGLEIFQNSYALRFKGISVGKNKLVMKGLSNDSSKFLGMSGERIIIDTGTALSYLPRKIYEPLEAAMKKEVKFEATRPRDGLRLCYTSVDGKMRGPIVTIHFVGANVRLYPVNTFVRVSRFVHCLGFVPHDGVAVLGNLAQINFLVGYDLKKKIVSIKQTDCSKQ